MCQGSKGGWGSLAPPMWSGGHPADAFTQQQMLMNMGMQQSHLGMLGMGMQQSRPLPWRSPLEIIERCAYCGKRRVNLDASCSGCGAHTLESDV